MTAPAVSVLMSVNDGAPWVAEAVASEAKGILPWGADHHRVFRKLNGHRIAASVICEDLPEEHNRVTLDRNGNLYLSGDTGRNWSRRADGLPLPSSVLIT